MSPNQNLFNMNLVRSGEEGEGAEEPVSSDDVLTTRERISKLLEESGDEEELMWKDTSFNM